MQYLQSERHGWHIVNYAHIYEDCLKIAKEFNIETPIEIDHVEVEGITSSPELASDSVQLNCTLTSKNLQLKPTALNPFIQLLLKK